MLCQQGNIFYEGKQISWDIYLKYKRPADGWAHHAWHPLRFCPFILLWRRQLCCLHRLSLWVFITPMRAPLAASIKLLVLLKQPHHLWQHQIHETQALQGGSAAPSQSIKPRGSEALSSSRAPSVQPERQQRQRNNAGLMGSSKWAEQAGMQGATQVKAAGAEQQWHHWELVHSLFLNKNLIF